MSKTLVIVESPTKARTIEKFFGKDYKVLASYGHIRDLPNKASEIPAEEKKQKWSRIGINVDADFEPLYIIPEKKKKQVNELKKALKEAKELLLATDEDREGESISWHLLEVLKPKVPVKRLVFHEITKEAIQESLSTPRDVDQNLVRAQETRRIIDRLFGYSVSPVLWKKMAPRLSAGRVQSVAIRLLVERERERIAFRAASYWDLKGIFDKGGDRFEGELSQLGGKRIASGKDFDPKTGKLKKESEVVLLDEAAAKKLLNEIKNTEGKVLSVEERPYSQKPSAPFTTSTLQQEASRKLDFAAKRTMSVAQVLYENGLITYMRTDSTNLSEEAIRGARAVIEREYGKEYLSADVRVYKTKVKNAQEAHEAIRPAGADFAPINSVKDKFGNDAARLYELIWKRTIACQMRDSRGTRISVQIGVKDAMFRSSGSTIEFPGFLRAYVEGSDDPEAELAERERILPKLKEGDKLSIADMQMLSHETQPPPRYTEGSLIKELERLGIGRPSTWATIVDVVLSRDYAFKRGSALVPTFLATAVINLMERFFTDIIDYDYTARLEDTLDAISRGEEDSLKYLKSFYFGNGHPGLKNLVKAGEEKIDPREVCGIPLGKLSDGRTVEVRIGRFGPFLSDGTIRSSLPDEVAPEEMSLERITELLEQAAKGPETLGNHPETGEPIFLRKGRFGPYIQLREQVDGQDKPKMASLLPGMDPKSVTLEIAIKLLSLPRKLGKHPELNEEILAANGPYGPYIKCGTETRSIPMDETSPIDITFEAAVELLKQPKRRGRASKAQAIKEIGKHPQTQAAIVLKNGRYGLYVTDGKINASLGKNLTAEELTLEQALQLLEARAARM